MTQNDLVADPTVEVIEALGDARRETLNLIAPIPAEDLERVHSTLMSPIVWDLAHIAAFEDLWLIKNLGGGEMLRPELAETYDATETPRAERGLLDCLTTEEALEYLGQVRDQVVKQSDEHGVDEPSIYEMVLRHELQHQETIFQTIRIGRLDYDSSELGRPTGPSSTAGPTGLEVTTVEAGPFTVGADSEDFAYDNERGQHRVELERFEIGKVPVTTGDFLNFIDVGGYRKREWWSDEGWAWKETHEVERPLYWHEEGGHWTVEGHMDLHPHHPVEHVSWYEAEAFCNANGVRLPTEFEWEAAATAGYLSDTGNVWEWTGSEFSAYPGFEPYPYEQYSKVFFDSGYRVLRGGSWASSSRVATLSFRNWDFPVRRQIFSGFRIAV